MEWRDGWKSVDGKLKDADSEEDDEEGWTEYLARVQREEAAAVAARTRSAMIAASPAASELTAANLALPSSLVAKSNMDKEKLRGMLDEWDELSSACDDAVSTVCNQYKITV